jgi:hypothetical protein
MHSFKAIITKFADRGEKTGWSYVDLPADILIKLKLKSKKEFRIKGFIDDVKIERMVCFPIGNGNFILTINGTLRKKLGKKEGASVSVKFELDERDAPKSKELLDCLKEEPEALKQFETLTKAHQNYFHNYINSAKGIDTRAGRIVSSLNAMLKKQDYGEMIRSLQKKNI